MKNSIILASILAASVPAFAFAPEMKSPEVKVEVTARYSKGESLEVIASAAKTVNIAAAVLAPELLATGNTAENVLAAMIKAGYYPTEAIDVLVSLGADPGALLEATAAGGSFGGSNFSNSRTPTIGGGGSQAVSRS
jgi:uracil phosphoribosyltransferase